MDHISTTLETESKRSDSQNLTDEKEQPASKLIQPEVWNSKQFQDRLKRLRKSCRGSTVYKSELPKKDRLKTDVSNSKGRGKHLIPHTQAGGDADVHGYFVTNEVKDERTSSHCLPSKVVRQDSRRNDIMPCPSDQHSNNELQSNHGQQLLPSVSSSRYPSHNKYASSSDMTIDLENLNYISRSQTTRDVCSNRDNAFENEIGKPSLGKDIHRLKSILSNSSTGQSDEKRDHPPQSNSDQNYCARTWQPLKHYDQKDVSKKITYSNLVRARLLNGGNTILSLDMECYGQEQSADGSTQRAASTPFGTGASYQDFANDINENEVSNDDERCLFLDTVESKSDNITPTGDVMEIDSPCQIGNCGDIDYRGSCIDRKSAVVNKVDSDDSLTEYALGSSQSKQHSLINGCIYNIVEDYTCFDSNPNQNARSSIKAFVDKTGEELTIPRFTPDQYNKQKTMKIHGNDHSDSISNSGKGKTETLNKRKNKTATMNQKVYIEGIEEGETVENKPTSTSIPKDDVLQQIYDCQKNCAHYLSTGFDVENVFGFANDNNIPGAPINKTETDTSNSDILSAKDFGTVNDIINENYRHDATNKSDNIMIGSITPASTISYMGSRSTTPRRDSKIDCHDFEYSRRETNNNKELILDSRITSSQVDFSKVGELITGHLTKDSDFTIAFSGAAQINMQEKEALSPMSKTTSFIKTEKEHKVRRLSKSTEEQDDDDNVSQHRSLEIPQLEKSHSNCDRLELEYERQTISVKRSNEISTARTVNNSHPSIEYTSKPTIDQEHFGNESRLTCASSLSPDYSPKKRISLETREARDLCAKESKSPNKYYPKKRDSLESLETPDCLVREENETRNASAERGIPTKAYTHDSIIKPITGKTEMPLSNSDKMHLNQLIQPIHPGHTNECGKGTTQWNNSPQTGFRLSQEYNRVPINMDKLPTHSRQECDTQPVPDNSTCASISCSSSLKQLEDSSINDSSMHKLSLISKMIAEAPLDTMTVHEDANCKNIPINHREYNDNMTEAGNEVTCNFRKTLASEYSSQSDVNTYEDNINYNEIQRRVNEFRTRALMERVKKTYKPDIQKECDATDISSPSKTKVLISMKTPHSLVTESERGHTTDAASVSLPSFLEGSQISVSTKPVSNARKDYKPHVKIKLKPKENFPPAIKQIDEKSNYGEANRKRNFRSAQENATSDSTLKTNSTKKKPPKCCIPGNVIKENMTKRLLNRKVVKDKSNLNCETNGRRLSGWKVNSCTSNEELNNCRDLCNVLKRSTFLHPKTDHNNNETRDKKILLPDVKQHRKCKQLSKACTSYKNMTNSDCKLSDTKVHSDPIMGFTSSEELRHFDCPLKVWKDTTKSSPVSKQQYKEQSKTSTRDAKPFLESINNIQTVNVKNKLHRQLEEQSQHLKKKNTTGSKVPIYKGHKSNLRHEEILRNKYMSIEEKNISTMCTETSTAADDNDDDDEEEEQEEQGDNCDDDDNLKADLNNRKTSSYKALISKAITNAKDQTKKYRCFQAEANEITPGRGEDVNESKRDKQRKPTRLTIHDKSHELHLPRIHAGKRFLMGQHENNNNSCANADCDNQQSRHSYADEEGGKIIQDEFHSCQCMPSATIKPQHKIIIRRKSRIPVLIRRIIGGERTTIFSGQASTSNKTPSVDHVEKFPSNDLEFDQSSSNHDTYPISYENRVDNSSSTCSVGQINHRSMLSKCEVLTSSLEDDYDKERAYYCGVTISEHENYGFKSCENTKNKEDNSNSYEDNENDTEISELEHTGYENDKYVEMKCPCTDNSRSHCNSLAISETETCKNERHLTIHEMNHSIVCIDDDHIISDKDRNELDEITMQPRDTGHIFKRYDNACSDDGKKIPQMSSIHVLYQDTSCVMVSNDSKENDQSFNFGDSIQSSRPDSRLSRLSDKTPDPLFMTIILKKIALMKNEIVSTDALMATSEKSHRGYTPLSIGSVASIESEGSFGRKSSAKLPSPSQKATLEGSSYPLLSACSIVEIAGLSRRLKSMETASGDEDRKDNANLINGCPVESKSAVKCVGLEPDCPPSPNDYLSDAKEYDGEVKLTNSLKDHLSRPTRQCISTSSLQDLSSEHARSIETGCGHNHLRSHNQVAKSPLFFCSNGKPSRAWPSPTKSSSSPMFSKRPCTRGVIGRAVVLSESESFEEPDQLDKGVDGYLNSPSNSKTNNCLSLIWPCLQSKQNSKIIYINEADRSGRLSSNNIICQDGKTAADSSPVSNEGNDGVENGLATDTNVYNNVKDNDHCRVYFNNVSRSNLLPFRKGTLSFCQFSPLCIPDKSISQGSRPRCSASQDEAKRSLTNSHTNTDTSSPSHAQSLEADKRCESTYTIHNDVDDWNSSDQSGRLSGDLLNAAYEPTDKSDYEFDEHDDDDCSKVDPTTSYRSRSRSMSKCIISNLEKTRQENDLNSTANDGYGKESRNQRKDKTQACIESPREINGNYKQTSKANERIKGKNCVMTSTNELPPLSKRQAGRPHRQNMWKRYY